MKYFDLDRFVNAQDSFDTYEEALQEIKDGEKTSHWIWYVFPNIAGLGRSSTAQMFAIQSLFEACAYLQHPVLGQRLREITEAVYEYNDGRDIEEVMGSHIDAVKLRSCMTLFDILSPEDIFNTVLERFFQGERDMLTLQLLGDQVETLIGRDIFSQVGIKGIKARAFLEGFDTEERTPEQLLATLLDLMKRGHSLVAICQHHLNDHQDIHSPLRTSEMEFCLCSRAQYLLRYFEENLDGGYSPQQLKVFQDYYRKFDERDFEYCLDAASLFEEMVETVRKDSQLVPILEELILKESLIGK